LAPKGLAEAYVKRGDAYTKKKEYGRAIYDYDQAIRLDPTADGYNSRCWTRALSGRDLSKALGDCDASLQLLPGDAHTFNSRGLVQFKLGDFAKAIADYDAALRSNPKHADSLYGRGMAKLKSGDTVAGEADIAAAKALQANIAEIYAGYGVK
jgi:tetratricopeptide (TPR) repeat protein